jgi:LemA protein
MEDLFMTNIIWIVVIALVALLVWAISAYNLLIRLKALVGEGWSGVSVQLKRRYDLIPNIVATVKGYSAHEKGVFERVTQLRSQAMSAQTLDASIKAETGLTSALKTLFAVAESYPELKANENFLSLQKELSVIENDINLARRYYNGVARNYNIAIHIFPRSIIARFFGFAPVAFFELDSEQEKAAPRVEF